MTGQSRGDDPEKTLDAALSATSEPAERRVPLFRIGRSQVVRIPKDLELPGTKAILRREAHRLVIESAPTSSNLLRALAALSPTDEDFTDIDAGISARKNVSP